MNELKIRTKLLLLFLAMLSGFMCVLVFNYSKIIDLRIDGPYYKKIIEGKNLLTYITPSPLNLTPAYLLAFQEVNEDNPKILNELIQKNIEFNKAFEKRAKIWSKTLPKDLEKNLSESILLSKEFIAIWTNEFLPSIQKKDREHAQNLLNNKLKEIYLKEQQASEKAIEILQHNNQDIEDLVLHKFNTGRIWALLTWVLTFIFIALIAYFTSRSITQRLMKALKQMSSVSEEINFRMDQQAKSILQQSSSANATTAAMDELNQSFYHIKSLAQESSHRAKNALNVSAEGNNLIKELVDGMMEHKEKVTEILNHILHFSEIINRIHTVASSINNLTNQTNILALNAAVQAAHVKQSSEGFSVIAYEIRKLADESKKFVAHIDTLAGNIKQATESTIEIAKEGSHTVQESIKLALQSSKSFDAIIAITNNSFEGTEQVSSNIGQQTLAVQRVKEAMEILNDSIQKNLQDMKQVKSELEKLNYLSEDLKSIV